MRVIPPPFQATPEEDQHKACFDCLTSEEREIPYRTYIYDEECDRCRGKKMCAYV